MRLNRFCKFMNNSQIKSDTDQFNIHLTLLRVEVAGTFGEPNEKRPFGGVRING